MIRRYDYADKNYMIQSAIQIWVMIEIDNSFYIHQIFECNSSTPLLATTPIIRERTPISVIVFKL
jgi:hypothetical protein